MIAEIITIGDEILIGQTIDTNSAWLGQQFNSIGISIRQIRSIQDERTAILEALDAIDEESQLVLMTGGLGPTQDDITKSVLCEYFDTELVLNKEVAGRITSFFESRGREMLDSNLQQAALPKTCTILENKLGTASGMWFEKNGVIFVSMPGVPYEMKGIISHEVIPRIKQKFSLPVILHKTIMTEGIGESFLVELIKDWEKSLEQEKIKIAYLPSPGIVKIRLSLFGRDLKRLEGIAAAKIKELHNLIPQFIFAEEDISMAQASSNMLHSLGITISTAESCTGGYLAHLLTSIPGSSDYFKGSIIAYANEVKETLLGVSASSIVEDGAVSRVVVEQMALGAQKKFQTDYALASSGIAGPDGGSDEKPVGTVWIALAFPGGVYAKKFLFEQNRERNIRRATYAALSILRRKIRNQLN